MTASFPVISPLGLLHLVQFRRPSIITEPGDKHQAYCFDLDKFDFKVFMSNNDRTCNVSASGYVTALEEQFAIGKTPSPCGGETGSPRECIPAVYCGCAEEY
jgi:hypothetical protein